jgi:hypothetical protein
MKNIGGLFLMIGGIAAFLSLAIAGATISPKDQAELIRVEIRNADTGSLVSSYQAYLKPGESSEITMISTKVKISRVKENRK